MLGSHDDAAADFRVIVITWEHLSEIEDEFAAGMAYDGEIRVVATGYLRRNFDADVWFFIHILTIFKNLFHKVSKNTYFCKLWNYQRNTILRK